MPSNISAAMVHWAEDHIEVGRDAIREWKSNLESWADQGVSPPPRPKAAAPAMPFLESLLPYLKPARVDLDLGEIVFSSRDREVLFSALSSGEKDLLTLALIIDSYGDDKSLILFDEPELHVHPDLVRTRLSVLRDAIGAGQVIIATHSYEAIEVAGEASTFILRRSDPDGPVDIVESWGKNAAFKSLAISLGWPSFSLAGRRFIFVEGEPNPDTHNRFGIISGGDTESVFIPVGGWTAVRDHHARLTQFAELGDSLNQLRFGAVVDRDFRTEDEIEELSRSGDIHVLGYRHEENLFLEPSAIEKVMKTVGCDQLYESLLREVADETAGNWIYLLAASRMPTHLAGTLKSAPMTNGSAIKWSRIDQNRAEWAHGAASPQPQADKYLGELIAIIEESIEEYATVRLAPELWKWCYGKSALKGIASKIGLKSDSVLVHMIGELWKSGQVEPSEVLRSLRDWIESR